MLLMFAVGCVGADATAEDQTGSVSQNTGSGGFDCYNNLSLQIVSCVGSIAVLLINVNIHDIGVLNDNDLTVLSDNLNGLSILDGGILNYNTILNDVETNVLNYALNNLHINGVTNNDIDVCTVVGLVHLCK
jgi:hypothetical protein